MVAVETLGDKPRVAARRQVPKVGAAEIEGMVRECLKEEALSLTHGWRDYRVIASWPQRHKSVATGSDKNAGARFPQAHTVIANVTGNIHRVYNNVGDKILSSYLRGFCYRFNRRLWDPQCLTGGSLFVLRRNLLMSRS